MRENIEQHPNIHGLENTTREQPIKSNDIPPLENESPATRIATAELRDGDKQEIAEVDQEVRTGLGALYETLHRQGSKIEVETIKKAIDDIERLRALGPAVKIAVAGTINKNRYNEKGRDEFIRELLKIEPLSLWIHMEGLNRADDKRLAKIRRDIQLEN
ncbi:hypothetical protein KKF61_00775 [Patescibacteria group bacterium]|nr:hypothetical protein [Patescibacteria group bacterium]MBU0964615.1 hypothetical protein [Patescibacteria group bacterium]